MTIVIDGTIGAGKTTQLDLLEKKGFCVHREPIDKWPLEEFYSDPSRWAFYFHMVIFLTENPLCQIHERSILSARGVFWEILLRKGLVTRMEHETYDAYFEKFKWFPKKYIFLKKSPEKAHQHIQTRGQSGDSKVSLEYLRELEAQYETFLDSLPCEVHVIDGERSPEEIHEEIIRLIS
jgi:deoxyadenosine/deoxycytidine kinase